MSKYAKVSNRRGVALRWLLALGAAALLTACDKLQGKASTSAPGGVGGNAAASSGRQGSGSGGIGPSGSKAPRKFPVRVQEVRSRPVQYQIEAVGSLVEENRFEIPARLAGPLEGVSVSEGDIVSTGQVLARIDPTRFRLQAERARNQVEQAAASLRTAEARLQDTSRGTTTALQQAQLDLELAQSEYRRRQTLNSAVITPEDRKQYESRLAKARTAYTDAQLGARTQLALSEAAVFEARSAVEAAQAQFALAQEDLQNSEIHSPYPGRIESKTMTNGQYVKEGQMVALVVQTDPLRLRFTVPESRTAALSERMKVRFSVPAYPTKNFEAHVYDVGSISDSTSREVTCWARLPNREGALRPGYFAKVTIETERHGDAVVVPLAAVLPTEKGMVAYIVQDGIAVQRTVQTGLQVSGDAIEILKGLDVGDQLVVEGAASLQPNVGVDVRRDVVADSGATTATTGTATTAAVAPTLQRGPAS